MAFRLSRIFIIITVLLLPLLTQAQTPTSEKTPHCNNYQKHRQAFFGDLHIHTALSLDAAMQGTLTGPEDAYNYAKGKAISIPPYGENNKPLNWATIDRPLDFAAVTDHAETLGELQICSTPGVDGYWSTACMAYRYIPRWGGLWITSRASEKKRTGACGDDGKNCLKAALSPWQKNIAAAEQSYDKSNECNFTSFVAYEWSGMANIDEGVGNLHRNVVFKNSKVPTLPKSFIDAPSADKLWHHLEDDCSNGGEGCDAVVIPHNSNISLGMMFQTTSKDGSNITAEDARRRQKYETLVEIIQHKGASECYGGLNTTDELCDFEQLPWDNFAGNTFESMAKPIKPDAGFVRDVLIEGLSQEQKLGVNPFKFGFIGSTDTHKSLAGGVSEKNFPGHGGAGNAASAADAEGLPDEWEFNPGGLAVLYAEENTRESLFAAMQRREAYATSGPRINVRFFGGWDYDENLCTQPDFIDQGYTAGVPMGADLKKPENSNSAPRFAVSALKDPGTINQKGVDLQRLQVIKGWVDAEGTMQSKVFDVAGNKNNGAGVNLNSCEPTGSGAASLCSVWKDPEFKAEQSAYYYARVLENPSCRWSTHICNQQKVDCSNPDDLNDEQAECCNPDMKKTVQERAWSSPIWYRTE
ncbi:hypothetical protein EOPP23_12570 [Endozoicomonas sp. OPT23]|uniref:DUF3604 domain-containing protein n=1 Tax=Endozoicomonas sp. OPT23 TaxID=2072845 RepID=UPI00129C0A73|nr:DUF3604 domain-containing protein [Endozoicomonas sp. OPT23]MRI33820.1 hypothetical protein [Endozoicomonas sp. OPT23]